MFTLHRFAYAVRFMLIGWQHPVSSFRLGWHIRGVIHDLVKNWSKNT